MKLTEMAVNNFRGIKGGLDKNRIQLEKSDSIFIIGQNNVGKTSFLHAYECFYTGNITKEEFTFGLDKGAEIELTFTIEEEREKDLINEKTNNKYQNIKENYLDNLNRLRVKKIWSYPDRQSQDLTYNFKAQKWDDKAYASMGFGQIFQSLMLKPLMIKAMPSETEVRLIVNEVLKENAKAKYGEKFAKMKTLEKAIEDLQGEIYPRAQIEKYQNEVNTMFRELFHGYRVAIDKGESRAKVTHDKTGLDFGINFEDSEEGNLTDSTRMGHGAVRTAIFLLMIMRDHLEGNELGIKNYLILFEEPELFLHPKVTKQLRKLVYDVTKETMPFQVLCASHSPQMIDLAQDHSSIVRMVKNNSGTRMFQIKKENLISPEETSLEAVKQRIYEILRFDPFICESFYADEVILVEGDTEEIVLRGYFQLNPVSQDIFILNCNSCTNINFYQRIFSQFNIPYSIICDTDHQPRKKSKGSGWDGAPHFPNFERGVQKTIAEQFYKDQEKGIGRLFYVCDGNFEEAHEKLSEPLRYQKKDKNAPSKPLAANRYWNKILSHADMKEFHQIPIIEFVEDVVKRRSSLAKLVTCISKIRSQKQAESSQP